MPLEKLQEYQGRNPKPADFDAYWEKTLAEMRGIDARVELIPHALEASFAECFHLYFTGAHGARVHAKLLRPKEKHHLRRIRAFSGSPLIISCNLLCVT